MVFAGLMFSSHGSAVSSFEETVRSHPIAVESNLRDETEHFEQVYPLNANGRLSLSNVNGSIVVDAWERNEVKVEYTKIADSKERLSDVEVRINSRPEYLDIDTDYGDSKRERGWRTNNKLQVEFHVTAPRGAVLNEVETVNGSVTVSNFSNYTKVSAVNGGVSAVNLRGTASLSTVNGEVAADFDRLDNGNKINLNTVNGSARVVIPSDSNATFKVDSLNGNITNDFGLPVRKGKYVGRDLYGRVGSGDVVIRMSSVNGPLTISRKNDGKNPNPATDLLPQKKDDDDWDNDSEESMIDHEKLNKSIERSVKAVDKQVAKIQPEVDRAVAESVERSARSIEETAAGLRSEEFKQKLKDAMDKQKELGRLAPVAFLSAPRVEKKSESFQVKGVPTVTVGATGCSVDIKGWEKNEVLYRVVQFSDPRRPSPVSISESHSESAVTVNIQNPDGETRSAMFPENTRTVHVEIYVPRKAKLKITTDGAIRLEGVSGDVELNGGDESVNVRDVDGSLRVSTSDGRIRVIGFKGDVDAKTTDGAINLEGDFRGLTARANDGDVTLTLAENAQADLDATCFEIESEGIAVTRTGSDEKVCHYRIGNGGPRFRIETGGEIRVRGSTLLMASL